MSTDNYRRAIGVTTISQLFNYGVPLITFPLMVRSFDISLYGAWIEASTLSSLVYIFGLHGLGNAVGELLVRDSESRDSVFTNALYLFLSIGSGLAVLMFFLYSGSMQSQSTLRLGRILPRCLRCWFPSVVCTCFPPRFSV